MIVFIEEKKIGISLKVKNLQTKGEIKELIHQLEVIEKNLSDGLGGKRKFSNGGVITGQLIFQNCK